MLQTQTAIPCETAKNSLPMENDLTNTSHQIMLVNELVKIVKDHRLLRSLDLFLEMFELAGHGREEAISATSK